ncbi:hypothetical protein [Polaromonas sp. CG9_12]|nr:hypothetical protein [Polaromonas sp. CG9_12]
MQQKITASELKEIIFRHYLPPAEMNTCAIFSKLNKKYG